MVLAVNKDKEKTMAERLSIRREEEPTGIDRNKLRLWGLVIIALGVLSRGILQNRVLGVNSGGSEQLLEVLSMSGGMTAAAVALALQAVESCAVPVFALLLTDGFRRTGSVKRYFLRVAGTAVLSEIPYNFAMSGRLLDMSSRNPMFGLVLSMAALYFYRQYAENSFQNVLVKAFVCMAAVLWALILRVQYGASMVLIVSTLWFLWDRKVLKLLMASAVAICCCIGDPLFMFAPFGFLLTHFYNGEEGLSIRWLQYLMYPILLLLIGAVGVLLF